MMFSCVVSLLINVHEIRNSQVRNLVIIFVVLSEGYDPNPLCLVLRAICLWCIFLVVPLFYIKKKRRKREKKHVWASLKLDVLYGVFLVL